MYLPVLAHRHYEQVVALDRDGEPEPVHCSVQVKVGRSFTVYILDHLYRNREYEDIFIWMKDWFKFMVHISQGSPLRIS